MSTVIDLQLLDKTLPVADRPGLESSEVRLLEIYRLADQGEDLAAAERSQALFLSQLYDVRLLGFFCFGAFLTEGPACLPDLGAILLRTFGENWEAFGPIYKRARLCDGALSRLFRSIRERLTFHKHLRDERWNAWLAKTTPMTLSSFRNTSERLQAALAERLAEPRCTDELIHLDVWLKDELRPLLTAFPPPAETPAAMVPAPEPPAADPPAPLPPKPVEPAVPEGELLTQGYSLSPPGYITLALSPALASLIRKLQGFARLVERGQMNKAAIVADDIRQTLERFDARLFLPKLLSAYFRQLTTHVDELAPHWQDKDSPAWQMLEQFYLVDFDAFLED